MKKSKKITNFSELLDYKYGKVGTKRRKKFELKSSAFMIAELIKEARRKTKLTQDQLA